MENNPHPHTPPPAERRAPGSLDFQHGTSRTPHPQAWLPQLLWMEWQSHIPSSGMVGNALLRESNPYFWKCVLGVQIKQGNLVFPDFSLSAHSQFTKSWQPLLQSRLQICPLPTTPSATTFMVAISISHLNYSIVFCFALYRSIFNLTARTSLLCLIASYPT